MYYDYVIVGGGPAGLTLATYLPGKVALVERHPVLGGCHRVLPKPKFVEHGPRLYSGAYHNVREIIRDLGMRWDDIFQRTTFSPENIGGATWFRKLSVAEIAALTVDYTVFALFDRQHGKNVTMKQYGEKRGFSEASMAYVDLVCRFSDGAGAARYSLWEFLSGFDQHTDPFYVPKKPLAEFFEAWRRRLRADVFLGETVVRVGEGVVATNVQVLRARKVVLAIPPKHASALLERSGLDEPEFRDFAKKTAYSIYWSVSFFTTKAFGSIPETEWGIVPVTYPFGVLSAAATLFDVPSRVTGKTLRQTPDADVPAEIRRQLGLAEDVAYAYLEGDTPPDQAFVAAAGKGYFGPELACGIATVGCHNGNSSYNFTSMESAVQNALAYCGKPRIRVRGVGDALRAAIAVVVAVVVVAIMVVIKTRRSY